MAEKTSTHRLHVDQWTGAPEQTQAYHTHGYVIIENAVSNDQIDTINADALRICRGEYGSFVRWQPPAEGETDLDTLRRFLCIHHPHKISSVMADALAYPLFKDVLTTVIGPNVKCMQSMLFIKAAGKPGQAWHQDELYIPTRDRSLTGLWIALDDATIENGCLWAIPGSHRRGILWPQAVTDDDRFDCAAESYGFPYSDDDAVPLEVPRGSIVVFNGYLLHRSLPNRSHDGFRRVLVNHYMSAESLLPWHAPPSDTAQSIGTLDNRDIVMIAGEDPYHWKPLEELSVTHVRPDRRGGCGQAEKYRRDHSRQS